MGTATRAVAEAEVVGRFGTADAQLPAVCKCATATDGTNADVGRALAAALREMGLPPISAATLLDADVLACPDARLDELYDRAELRLARTLRNRLDVTRVTVRVGPGSEIDFNAVRQTLDVIISAAQQRITALYGDRPTGAATANMTTPVTPACTVPGGYPLWPGRWPWPPYGNLG